MVLDTQAALILHAMLCCYAAILHAHALLFNVDIASVEGQVTS